MKNTVNTENSSDNSIPNSNQQSVTAPSHTPLNDVTVTTGAVQTSQKTDAPQSNESNVSTADNTVLKPVIDAQPSSGKAPLEVVSQHRMRMLLLNGSSVMVKQPAEVMFSMFSTRQDLTWLPSKQLMKKDVPHVELKRIEVCRI
jgi:hypothetical protein